MIFWINFSSCLKTTILIYKFPKSLILRQRARGGGGGAWAGIERKELNKMEEKKWREGKEK